MNDLTPDLTPDETRRLRDAVAALPESVDPERDLWPDIRERIEATRVVALPREQFAPHAPRAQPAQSAQSAHRGPRVTWPRLAAAAAVLVLASVALTRWMTEPAVQTMVVAPAMDSAGTARAAVSFASFDSFERTAADLSATLDRRAGQLDPATRAVLERSLRTIDQAIAEAREALAADPASAAMRGFVESVYRQKVDFLRRANDVAALRGT